MDVVEEGSGTFVAGASYSPEFTNFFVFTGDWTDTVSARWWWRGSSGWLSSSGSGWTGGGSGSCSGGLWNICGGGS